MEEKIKEIISNFIKVPSEQIEGTTIINRSAVQSSILLHRMYASLAKHGFVIENYWDIINFKDLLQKISKIDNLKISTLVSGEASINDIPSFNNDENLVSEIGIDIEEISSMPTVTDFREDLFYKMNFAPSEISYCILQINPLASFAGLFAVKEAISKANNNYQNKPFNTIIIQHLPNGKPFINNFQISVSHSKNIAIGLAIKDRTEINEKNFVSQSNTSNKNYSLIFWLSLLAIIFSLICLIIILRLL